MIDYHYNSHIFGNTAFTLFLYSKYSSPIFSIYCSSSIIKILNIIYMKIGIGIPKIYPKIRIIPGTINIIHDA